MVQKQTIQERSKFFGGYVPEYIKKKEKNKEKNYLLLVTPQQFNKPTF